MEALISTLAWAAIINGFFLVGLYLFSRKYRSLANKLLGLFLLAIVYEGTLNFIPYNEIGGYELYYFAFPEVKLFYPVLFLHYILEKVGRSAQYRNFLRIHYVLAFAVAGITLLNLFLYFTQGQQLKEYLGNERLEFIFMAQQYYAFLLIMVAWVIAILEVNRYRSIVQKEYSDYGMLSINWLWGFIFSVLPIIIMWGMNLIWIIVGGRNQYDFELATWGFVIVFLYFVSFKAFKHNNLFEGLEDRQEVSLPNVPSKEDIRKNDLLPVISEQEDEAAIEKIQQYMHREEPFLNASLSIHQLAEQIDIPVRELSLLINHKLKKHFFDFVNEYRIEKAMEILRDPEQSQLTVLEVLYEVGFNSKSSFNTVFKKYTGQTPTQYRKKNQLA